MKIPAAVLAVLPIALLLLGGTPCRAESQLAMPRDYQWVADYIGKSADYRDHVLKISLPRNDLKVIVDGVSPPPSFGFSGWIAMTPGAGRTHVMMGDLVLLQEEVNPVMSSLLNHGVEVTALHNHFFREEPRLFYMHIHGAGRPADLAHRVKPAIELIGHVKQPDGSGTDGAAADTTAGPGATTGTGLITPGHLDIARLTRTIGHPGEEKAGVFKVTVARSDVTVREMGAIINARMGLNTWVAFVGSDQKAAIAGDVAMLGSEVVPVLRALRSHQVDVVAIHHHMIGTQPMIIFLHFWGKGPALQLAQGFRAALDQLGTARHGTGRRRRPGARSQ